VFNVAMDTDFRGIRFDGHTLVVRTPMRFQRRGGRERVVASDDTELVPATKPQPDGMLVKTLARAWRWQRMLDEGVYTSGQRDQRHWESLILRLALLGPDIIEATLAGKRTRA
jgi:hypothetical protein